MIAYREKYLAESVKDCYEKAKNPENLLFSIVSEQSKKELHANLDFIPGNQIIYRTYELTEYRGVLWSRAKTLEVDFDYDYILYTCGHNRFVENWDEKVFIEYQKSTKKAEKSLITIAAPEYRVGKDGGAITDEHWLRQSNVRRPKLHDGYIPGHGWADVVPFLDGETGLFEECYLQFSWVFAPKKYVEEVPLDQDMNYHGEEIYTTVQTWCRGWRMFTTPQILYYHDTYKEYYGEEESRMTTHRPWSDLNKDAFWKQSDESMLKLNRLLSGNLEGKYGNISKSSVLEYCNFSGLDPKWCEPDENFNKLTVKRHAEDFRYAKPKTEI